MANKLNIGQGLKGEISYNKEIVLSIIKTATMEVEGVSALSQNFGSALGHWFNGNYDDGVRIRINESVLTINLYLTVMFNHNVSELSYRVQENVKNAVTTMLGLEIDKINVHVLGVEFANDQTPKQTPNTQEVA